MGTTLLTVAMLLLALVFGGLVHFVRTERVSQRGVQVLATACGLGLLAMVLTDWPTGALNIFWAEHSILAGVGSTVFMVGIGYLVWEWADRAGQDRLADGLSGAGLGGIVDHVVDAEVALALVSADHAPAYKSWDAPAKPLRWLRQVRPELARAADDGRPSGTDPRHRPVHLPEADHEWRVELVDQATRRLLAAMRDWAPLIGSSKDGTTALLILSEVRKDLMELSYELSHNHAAAAESLLLTLRQRLRILAFFFEDLSRNSTHATTDGADTPMRPEVLLAMWPLPKLTDDFRWEADQESLPSFGRTRQQRLDKAIKQLDRDSVVPMTVDDARELARKAHAGQVTQQGVDYFTAHLEPIAARLERDGHEAVIAGWLHDVLEDTDLTSDDLLRAGASPAVVHAVESVSKRDGEPYDDLIRRAAADPLGRVVKLADNEQNLADNPALAEIDPEKAARLREKYQVARTQLLDEETS